MQLTIQELKHLSAFAQMTLIYESRFQRIGWSPTYRLMFYGWTTETAFFTEAEYQHEHKVIGDVSEQYKVVNHLIDTFHFRFTIPPHLQEWVGANLFPRLEKSDTQKMSFVVPPDVFAQVSIQQTMEEDTRHIFQIHYFENTEDAHDWLLDSTER